MQFDQRILVRLVLVAALLAAGAAQWWRGGSPSDAPQPAPVATAEPIVPDAAEERSPVEAPQDAISHAPPVSQGAFDYYVLVLSWSPTHCSGDAGRGRDDDRQCRSGRPYGFVLHGLWPQNERGYPQSCATGESHEVSAENMERALKVAPSERLVQHEWEKHGTCAGLAQDDYFATAVTAYSSIHVPGDFQAPASIRQTTPDEVREAFLKDNAALTPDQVSATCSRNELAEIWVCLEKNLQPRACSPEVRKRHCGARHVRMLAVRGDWP